MQTVAACQFEVVDLDPPQNTASIVDRLEHLDEHVDLAVFPEYAVTGFVADARARASAIPRDGPLLDSIADHAATHDIAVVVGFLETTAGTLHNSLAYLDPDGTRTVYRKRHLWSDEADYVVPGETQVRVDTPIGTAGLVTCYDLNFVAESAAFTDPPVDALIVAGAWPAPYAANWDLLLRARALDGVRWVVGAGRTGRNETPGTEQTVYAGRSAIVRPDGSLVGRLNRQNRDLIRTIDSAELDDHRRFIGSVD